ncbi:MAG: hypothetical protein ACREJP_09450, partial [Candidatus Methylomirabilales bacterium]
FYKSLSESLSFEASACASGYYHGVVEKRLSGYEDTELLAKIPTVCDEVRKPYSLAHYNCMHGVGHGVMLRFKAELARALPYCEAVTDGWELSSCVSGVFMENLISAQDGHVAGTFKADDPIYPCNAVKVDYRDECFGMQTSYFLWKNGHNYAQGFQICDAVEQPFAGDCYQSMGRDISGAALLDVARVVASCNLGQSELRGHCLAGASMNAVYTEHDTVKATQLCEAVEPAYVSACITARDRIAATF